MTCQRKARRDRELVVPQHRLRDRREPKVRPRSVITTAPGTFDGRNRPNFIHPDSEIDASRFRARRRERRDRNRFEIRVGHATFRNASRREHD